MIVDTSVTMVARHNKNQENMVTISCDEGLDTDNPVNEKAHSCIKSSKTEQAESSTAKTSSYLFIRDYAAGAWQQKQARA